MKIVSTAKIRKDLQQDLKGSFPDQTFYFYRNREEAEQDLKDAEICITYGEDLDEEIIRQCSELKWIMVISAGVEKMPLNLIREKEILVTNAKGIHKIPMAEYTFGMILQYMKDLPQFQKQQQEKDWNRSVKMAELYAKTLTIIGPGAIGGEIARLAKAFGMKTNGINRSGNAVNHIDCIYKLDAISEAVEKSDIVVSVLPYTNETAGLIDKQVFDSMPDESLFVNIGRGKTVVQNDLLKALEAGGIRHAVLDVFEEEPLPKDHPFWEMASVTLTPHISSITSEYQPRSLEIFKNNLSSYLNGKNNYQNVIDTKRGY